MSPRALTERFVEGEPTAWLGWDPAPQPFEETLAAWKRSLARRGRPGSPATLHVYGHFAYCRMHCLFCQCWHVLSQNEGQYEAQTDAMVRTLARYRETLGRVDATNASFGGGTPTAISASMLRRFLDAFRATFNVRHELACEGHPATLDDEKLAMLLGAGVNRISMGLQSLDPDVLSGVGRSNDTLPRIRKIVRGAQRGGAFVNLDLILGLPKQTVASFEEDFATAMDVGPDMLTVYRYQPVAKMPQPPDETMRIERVFTRARLLAALRRGYVTPSALAPGGYSVLFFRGTERVARFGARSIAAWARARLGGSQEIPRYTDLDSTEVQILGFGTGATSHLYGHGWYREVSAVRTLETRGDPLLWGTRLTMEDEARTALMLALSRGESISLRRLEQVSGVDECALLAPLSPGLASGAVVRSRGRVSFARHATPESRRAALQALLPRRDSSAQAARARVDRTDTFGARPEVQKGLLELDPALRESAEELVTLRRSAGRPAGDGRTLAAWCGVLGLRAGERVEGALVERLEGNAIHFRVDAGPDRSLVVEVGAAGSGRSYWESERFAVAYVARPDQPIVDAELRFLDVLRDRTRAAER